MLEGVGGLAGVEQLPGGAEPGPGEGLEETLSLGGLGLRQPALEPPELGERERQGAAAAGPRVAVVDASVFEDEAGVAIVTAGRAAVERQGADRPQVGCEGGHQRFHAARHRQHEAGAEPAEDPFAAFVEPLKQPRPGVDPRIVCPVTFDGEAHPFDPEAFGGGVGAEKLVGEVAELAGGGGTEDAERPAEP